MGGERCAEPWGHSLVALRNRALSCGPAFVPCIPLGEAVSICSTCTLPHARQLSAEIGGTRSTLAVVIISHVTD